MLEVFLKNHARNLCRSALTICEISMSVSVLGMESENAEKRLNFRLTSGCRDMCGGDTKKISFVSNFKM